MIVNFQNKKNYKFAYLGLVQILICSLGFSHLIQPATRRSKLKPEYQQMLSTTFPVKIWRQVPSNAMAILSSNLALNLAIHMRIRAPIIPWVELKAGCIKCTNARDFSSSFPVRYIPRKNLESRESEGFSPATVTEPTYSARDQLNKDIQRVEFSRNHLIPVNSQTKFQNESLNLGVGFGVEEDFNCQEHFEDDSILNEPEEVMYDLEVSEEQEQNENDGVLVSRIQQDVENLAVKILAKRAFTAAELRKKLLGKQFPRATVDAVILDFKKRGIVNDSLYAETYSRSRWSTSTWGPRRIKKALTDKGVNNEDVDKAVKLVLNDAKSTRDEEESELGMSHNALNHLFVQSAKQWLRSVNMPRETRRSRIVRWLQYRGFSWNIISVVLKKLESDNHI